MSRLMSKVINRVGSRRYADMSSLPFDEIVSVDTRIIDHKASHLIEQIVEVNIGTSVLIEEDTMYKSELIHKQLLTIQEEVFGEFRRDLYLLRMNLQARRYEDAMKNFDAIYEVMYSVK